MAANLATVIFVAAAIAFVHGFNSTIATKAGRNALPGLPHTPSSAALFTTAGSVLIIAYGIAIMRGYDPVALLFRQRRPTPKTWGRYLIWLGSFVALEAVLLLAGLAAGVK